MKNKVLAVLILGVVAAAVAIVWIGGRSGPPETFDDLSRDAQEEYRSALHLAQGAIRSQVWDEAEGHLRRCLTIWGEGAEPHALLAKALVGKRLGLETGAIPVEAEDALVDEALRSIERALALDPENVTALMERFHIHHVPRLRRYNPDISLEAGETLLRLVPDNENFRQLFVAWLLGGARFRRLRGTARMAFDSAIGSELAQRYAELTLDRAPAGSDLHVQALQGLGTALIYMGDFDGAVDALERVNAYKLPPDIEAVNLKDVGIAHFRMGRYGEAAAAFLKSIDTRKSWDAAWLLRRSYDAMGRDVNDLPETYVFPLPRVTLSEEEEHLLEFTEVGEALGVAKVDGAGPSAFADYDNDGDPDIFVTGCDTFAALYRNDGERFTDVTIEAGLVETESGFSTNFVDYDDDGDLDIYICRNGWSGAARNTLLRNRGDGTFEDVSGASGVDDPGNGWMTFWADFDGDGPLDLYVVNGVLREGSTSRLYRNRGDGTFQDVTEAAGLAEPPHWGAIGGAAGDYDRDGDVDIFITGRRMAPDRLYRNRGDGTFEEVARQAGIETPPKEGYIALFFDYDNDALPDLLTTSVAPWKYTLLGMARLVVPRGPQEIQRNAPHLYRNQGDGTFREVTFEAGVAYPLGVMSVNTADLDNDGYLDLFTGTGDPDLKRLEPAVFYRNRGDGTFIDLARPLGLDHVGKGHGIAFGDHDLDGDLDIYAPQGGFVHGDQWANPFYRNERGNRNHWIHLKLRGVKSNRYAVGAQVTLRSGGGVQYREVVASVGFGSTNSYPVEFGLGEATEIDSVEILWPSGHRQTIESPPVDAMIEVIEYEEGWRVIHRGRAGR